jgi:Ti-type conjugative transfer relaxase TraA
MAIYHFSAKVIQRSQGRSAVAAAAYRSGCELEDARLGQTFDYRAKDGVVHSEIIAPAGAPGRWQDRSTLWNEVEAIERRKDAVLAREIEFALPRELSKAEGIALAQDFVREQFVARGMVADLNVHWTRDPDGEIKPHAHVMLSMREIDGDGFGKKQRDWNDVGLLRTWRERWADVTNARLLELGHDIRIDHRSLRDQGIDLEPQHKIGPAGARREERGEEAERAAEHRDIARRNGEALLAEPGIALKALTHQHSTFTRQDLARFVDRHTDGAEQFSAVLAKVEAAPELVRVGEDGRGRDRFTTREMLETERRMEQAAAALAGLERHGITMGSARQGKAEADRRGLVLGAEQTDALELVTNRADLALVVGYAGTGKSAMLGVARATWEAERYIVRGLALSGIAAEGLEAGSGIPSRTIASLEHAWGQGRDELTNRDVLVVDEAGMIGSRQMERLLSAAQRAGAKVVLVGDPEQLQAIEAGAAFRALAERHGAAEITAVRRQHEDWQRDATRELATGRTAEALERYTAAGMVQASGTREEARAALVAGWDAARQARPEASQVILAYTRDDVRALNELARAQMRAAGDLRGADQVVATERGERAFAAGDRIMFQRNERGLGGSGPGRDGVAVKNGTLGTVLEVAAGGERLTVRLDGAGRPGRGQEEGKGGREVTFSPRDYAHIDHGYAATVHKAQGVTVDRAHVLATPHMDRHAAYVGLTRHRDGVALHYAREDFSEPARLVRTLGRERAKDTSLDYPQGWAPDREDELVRRYAARRGLAPESEIVVRAPERAREAPQPAAKHGRFSGLKLDAGRASPPEVGRAVPSVESTQARPLTEWERQQERMEGLVAGYARAWADTDRMRRASLPVLPHQEQALQAADRALEAFASRLSWDVRAALEATPALAAGIETKEGRQALTAAAAVAQRDRQALDQRVREAVRGWDALEQAHDQAAGRYDWGAARAVTQRLEAYAQALKQDPQLEGVLRTRGAEFGVEKGSRLELVVQAPEVTERLIRQVGLEQARGWGRDSGPSLGR